MKHITTEAQSSTEDAQSESSKRSEVFLLPSVFCLLLLSVHLFGECDNVASRFAVKRV